MVELFCGKIKSFFSGKKPMLALTVLVGTVLIILSSSFIKNTDDDTETTVTGREYESRFIEENEARLTDIVSSIDGVGRVKLMISLETGAQMVYKCEENTERDASEGRVSYSSETSATVISTKDGDAPLTVTYIEPVIKGVAVVCEGADIPHVTEMVVDAVSKALGISSNRISVTKLAE